VEVLYTLSATCDRHGNPSDAYIMSIGEGGQMSWVSDASFGPFDTWLDLLAFWRKSLSLDMDRRFVR
jgi:hypothetical protein